MLDKHECYEIRGKSVVRTVITMYTRKLVVLIIIHTIIIVIIIATI